MYLCKNWVSKDTSNQAWRKHAELLLNGTHDGLQISQGDSRRVLEEGKEQTPHNCPAELHVRSMKPEPTLVLSNVQGQERSLTKWPGQTSKHLQS